MKPTLRITRCNFPNQSMIYWFTYFKSILEQKYDVIVDSENPDLLFYSNVYFSTDMIDDVTGKLARGQDSYSSNVKKIFCSGEIVSNHQSVLNEGSNYFAIGPQPEEHPRYLRMQLHNTTAAWGLYEESKLVDTPYSWLLQQRDGDTILARKKHFCGVVQNSSIPPRIELFNKLTDYKFVRASGGWITNVPPEEATARYMRLDGDSYKSKVEFLSNCKFSIQVQSSNLPYFTHEKMIHAFAANTIPIFYGNSQILEDGFNPEAFINCHEYDTFDQVVERVKEIDSNDELYKHIVTQPYFVDNKLPDYFNPEYILNFIEKVLNA